MRVGWIVWGVLVVGCGARSSLSVDPPEDAAQPTVDAGTDAGRDAGTDAGTPQVACAADADCDRGVCRAIDPLRPRDLAMLPLVCGDADPGGLPVGDACSNRRECDRGLCTISGACVMPCATDLDCPGGERCFEVWVQTSGTSMQPLEACAPVVAAPESVRVSGPTPGPALPGGFPRAVDERLSDLAESTLVVWTAQPSSIPLIQEIRTAAGAVLYDSFAGGPGAPTPAWGVTPATVSDVVTLLYPNGPNTPRSEGGFTVALGSFEPSTSERIELERAGEGAVFDIDAYLVGGGGWGSPGGDLPPALAAAIAQANVLYAEVGLAIGEVRVHAVVGQLRRDFSVLEGESGLLGAPPELPELFRLSAGARRPSVSVFFVRMIDGAAGIASGIPGPHAMHGTGASGVAIAVDIIPRDWLPLVMVHEIGHFMGLFHTSELDGSVNDPLPDTAECRPEHDANRDGLLLPGECRGAGAENVMFWSGEEREISAQQGAIMRRAFFVR